MIVRIPTRRGLGDQPSDSTSYFNAVDQFRTIRAQLNQLESEAQVNPTFAGQYGAKIVEAENFYQDLLSKFLVIYRAAFGTVPSGLAQFQAIPAILTVATVLALLGYLAYQLQPIFQAMLVAQQTRLKTAETQQAQATAQQVVATGAAAIAQQVQAQANAARAAGNNQLADQLQSQVTQLLGTAQTAAGSPTSGTPDWVYIVGLLAAGTGLYFALT